MSLDGKSILVTGGTGTFGQAFVEYVLEHYSPERLIVFSRDEFKQYEMRQRFDGGPMRYFLGDVRDLERLRMAFRPVDIIVHAAALKHVPSGETNPIEVIKTNIGGAQNVITAAIEAGVERVIALSTDKAVNPVNLYGSTKLCAEKLFVGANGLSGDGGTKFSVARYGNVANSRGSVIPFFQKLAAQKRSIPITDVNMTRFFILIERAVEFVVERLGDMLGGEIFIPKAPSVRILALAGTICGERFPWYEIGVRPGEKINEILLSADEAAHSVDFGDFFAIEPESEWWGMPWPMVREEAPCAYSSDDNPHVLNRKGIKEMLDGFDKA